MNEPSCRIILLAAFALIFAIGCKDIGIDPISNKEYGICYEKFYNYQWEIFTNNMAGSNPQNVSNFPGDDEYPRCSPDGKHIVYSRRPGSGGTILLRYSIKDQINKILTSDSMEAGQRPQWTPNGKICFAYRGPFWTSPWGTYIMDSTGINKKKILDSSATILFYPDSYTFVYIMGTKVGKTNIDNTFDDFILDTRQTLGQSVTVQELNPYTDELLFTFKMSSGASAIAAYGLASKNIRVLLEAEAGFTFYAQVRYSPDYSKLALIEHSDSVEYLSVLENGVKKRFAQILAAVPQTYFSFNPMCFSPDGRYLAYSKMTVHGTGWDQSLFVVDVATGETHYVDEGHHPSWFALENQ